MPALTHIVYFNEKSNDLMRSEKCIKSLSASCINRVAREKSDIYSSVHEGNLIVIQIEINQSHPKINHRVNLNIHNPDISKSPFKIHRYTTAKLLTY